MEHQPLLEQIPANHRAGVIDALKVVMDYGQRMQDHTFNIIEAGGTLEDLVIIDTTLAHALLLLPHLRRKIDLKDSPITEMVKDEDINNVLKSTQFTVAELASSVVFVPVLGIAAT